MKQLPNLHQATLDNATLDELFSDIAALGDDIEVIPKRGARTQVGEDSMTLAQALDALRSCSIRAAQIRYTHEGGRWCDTLTPGQGGWRITRINLSQAATA